MKIYNIVLALMLVVMMAGAVSAAAPTFNDRSVTIESDDTVASVSFSATDPEGDTITYERVNEGDTAVATCTIDATRKILTVTRVSDAAGTSDCVIRAIVSPVEYTDATFSITVERKSMLTIDRVYVILNGESDRLDDGEDFEAVPGDTLSFEVRVSNEFSGDDEEDIEIEDVEVTIDIVEWDDDDDEEFESSRSIDIKPDDTEAIMVDIDDIPGTISDGTHKITITVMGEDEDGVDHKATWTLEMDIEKEDEDIQISAATLEPTTVSCNRNVILNVRLLNAGTDDSDEIVFTAKSSQLGISLQDYDIELDEGDSDTMEYNLKISDSVEPGTYPIKIATYFDLDRFEDDDISTLKTIQLTVEKCGADTPETPVTPEDEDDEEVEVVTPTEPTQPEEESETEDEVKTMFGISEKALIIGLVILNLLLLVAIILVIAKLLSN